MATKINREALRQRIKTLAGLSDDERAALLELVNSKKYGLVWENHPEAVEERLRTHLPVLDEVPERYIPGSSASSPNHILIEGDNLEALTALTYTHEGRIDVIYIDPPYNTGNKDFSYNDHYVDVDDDYRHSKWLSFMSKRLRIAKLLLSDRGVIFISIDDNEQANLKLLCDEVFGEHNFIAQLCWRRRKTQANLAKNFSQVHEYIYVFAKFGEHILINRAPYSKEYIAKTFKNPDNDSRGAYQTGPLARPANSSNREYTLTMPNGRNITAKWSCSQETFNQYVKEGRLIIPRDGEGMPRIKIYLSEAPGMIPNTWLDNIASNDDASRQIENLFGSNSAFSYAKPTELIEYIVRLIGNASSIILDFFAGSGTTMHAVMQLNKEDGGHRQCILVTNNENKICEEVTYERNRRVIQGYTTPKGVEVEGLRDNSLRYYRTRLLPRRRTNRNMRDLMAAATDLLCIKEDIFEELGMEGLAIKNIRRHVRLFGKGDRRMMVIYSEEAIPRIVEWLKTTPPLPSSEGWPKAGVCSNEGWPKAGVCSSEGSPKAEVAIKITHNLSEPTPNPSPGGDAAAPPAPIDATTTIPPAPIDATTTTPPTPIDATTAAPPAPVDATTTTPPAPVDTTTAAPAIPSSEGWPKAGVCSSEGWPKAGVCSSEGWPKAGVCSNPIKVYTFSYTNYAYDDDFAEVEDRVQLCALPAAIYEAYRRVLPQEDRYYDNEIIDGSDINEGKEDNQ